MNPESKLYEISSVYFSNVYVIALYDQAVLSAVDLKIELPTCYVNVCNQYASLVRKKTAIKDIIAQIRTSYNKHLRRNETLESMTHIFANIFLANELQFHKQYENHVDEIFVEIVNNVNTIVLNDWRHKILEARAANSGVEVIGKQFKEEIRDLFTSIPKRYIADLIATRHGVKSNDNVQVYRELERLKHRERQLRSDIIAITAERDKYLHYTESLISTVRGLEMQIQNLSTQPFQHPVEHDLTIVEESESESDSEEHDGDTTTSDSS